MAAPRPHRTDATALFLKFLILPPASLILLALVGWIVALRYRRIGQTITLLSLITAWLLMLPMTAHWLSWQLQPDQSPPTLTQLRASGAEAIIILGAGRDRRVPENHHQDHISWEAFRRLRHGVYLHRQLNLPILAAGGLSADAQLPEAELIAQALAVYFDITPRWLERRSANTLQNAQFSRAILADAGIDAIILVTNHLHMPRAQRAFTQAGFTVTPAPIALGHRPPFLNTVRDLLPSPQAFAISQAIFYEWLGRLWYQLRLPRSTPPHSDDLTHHPAVTPHPVSATTQHRHEP